MTKPNLGLRGFFAAHLGSLASWLSRALGRGAGGMIAGRVAAALDPALLTKLTKGKRVVLITGTNGKSTTTRMMRAIAEVDGSVASNVLGDNMADGILSALLKAPVADFAILEVDEMHLQNVAADVNPAGFILLNLSRDQLDRVGEITTVERRIRDTIDAHPQAFVVANVDDPLIASAAWDAPKVTWVHAGGGWMSDSTWFPRTGTLVTRAEGGWSVQDHPEFSRPQADWTVTDTGYTHGGRQVRLDLNVPGRVNLANATQAIAAGVALGIDEEKAAKAVSEVRQVAGRYAEVTVEGLSAQLLLAKNPAGWQEAMSMLSPDADAIVIAINGEVADGQDLSWIWDVDFSHLRVLAPNTQVFACGKRAADCAVRLLYADIRHEVAPSILDAIRASRGSRVQVLANYTAFRDFKALLIRRGDWTEEGR